MALIVTTSIDEAFDGTETEGTPDGTGLSLREAIGIVGTTDGNNTIYFAPSVQGTTIDLLHGPLVINQSTTIDNGGPYYAGNEKVTIDANGQHRVMLAYSSNINDGFNIGIKLEISGLVLTGGAAASTSVGGVAVPASGGGIFARGPVDLDIDNTIVRDNTAPILGGGILLTNPGLVEITRSSFYGNTAGFGGAFATVGVFDSRRTGLDLLSISSSTFHDNAAQVGGALYLAGQLEFARLSGLTLTDNSATRGGAIFSDLADPSNLSQDPVPFDLNRSTLTGNYASVAGSALYLKNSDPNGTINDLRLSNSIILGNTGGVPEIYQAGSSLIETGSNLLPGEALAADVFDPEGLADNGGQVKTIALIDSASNPALDAGGDVSGFGGFDARGRDPVDIPDVGGPGIVDLGSFELVLEQPSRVVTTAEDIVDRTDGETSLREAVEAINSGALAAGTRIVFASGAGQTFESGGTLILTQGELVLTQSMTLDGDVNGDGRPDITLSGGGANRILRITNGEVTLESLRLVDGVASTLAGPRSALNGGAIFASGDSADSLTIRDSEIANSSAATETGLGGAVYTAIETTIERSWLHGNSAGQAGGALYLTGDQGGTVRDSTISGNSASIGGGILADKSSGFRIENATIEGNTANLFGGGLANFYATTTVVNSTITGNAASSLGSGVYQTTQQGVNGVVTLTNSIVLGNGSAPQVSGNVTLAQSLDGSGGETAADVFAALDGSTGGGLLADNGGPVRTVALKEDAANPALDAGDDSAAPDADARGVARFDQASIANNGANTADLGAFEAPQVPLLVVTTLADVVNASDGETSLREAVVSANAFAGADTITFAQGLAGLIRLTGGEIEITDALTIDGGGVITVTGDADGDDVTDGNGVTDIGASGSTRLDDNSRVFNMTIREATTTLSGLTITGGYSRNPGGSSSGYSGGGLRSEADLELVDSFVIGNGTSGEGARGGGIYGAYRVTLTNSTVSGNTTSGNGSDGGGIAGFSVDLTNSTVSDNSASGTSAGGGVYSYTTVTLTNSTVSGNTSTGSGGGIAAVSGVELFNSTVGGNSATGSGAEGGGIYSRFSTVELTNSTLSGNSAAASGGGIAGYGATLTNSLVLGNVDGVAGTGTDDIGPKASGGLALVGGNVHGTNVFDGGADIGDTSVRQVFAAIDPTTGGGRLASNGGPVQTIALKADLSNPALDAGQDAAAPPTDARGQARVDQPELSDRSSISDLGAFELGVAIQPPTIGETGTLRLSHVAQTLTLERSYENPVVVAFVATGNGREPVAVRVSEVSGTTLTLALQEPNYRNGIHRPETVHYLVVEAGSHVLPDGTLIEAGTLDTNLLSAQGFESVSFASRFDAAPAVFSQVQTANDSDFVVTRQQGAEATGFRITMQEEERLNGGGHGSETLGWIAIDQGEGGAGGLSWNAGRIAGVNHEGASLPAAGDPEVVFAQVSGFVGADTAWARGDGAGGVWVEEEQSLDAEVVHALEPIDWLRFSDTGLLPALPSQTVLETGTLSLTDAAQTVVLQGGFIDPVALAFVATETGLQPVNVRLEDVSADSITLRLQEPDYLDGRHAAETVHFVVAEQGAFVLANGTVLEAGSLISNKLSTQGFEQVGFTAGFDAAPVVLSQVQTDNGASFVTTRQQAVEAGGFELTMQEEEALNGTGHASETLGWLAIEAGLISADGFVFGAGLGTVSGTPGAVALDPALGPTPGVVAGLASFAGADPAWARGAGLAPGGFLASAEEDRSFDTETGHKPELLSWLAFTEAGVITGYDMGLFV